MFYLGFKCLSNEHNLFAYRDKVVYIDSAWCTRPSLKIFHQMSKASINLSNHGSTLELTTLLVSFVEQKELDSSEILLIYDSQNFCFHFIASCYLEIANWHLYVLVYLLPWFELINQHLTWEDQHYSQSIKYKDIL